MDNLLGCAVSNWRQIYNLKREAKSAENHFMEFSKMRSEDILNFKENLQKW